jgi:hypothetical protein
MTEYRATLSGRIVYVLPETPAVLHPGVVREAPGEGPCYGNRKSSITM